MILVYARIISNRTDGTSYEWHLLEAEINEKNNEVNFVNTEELRKLTKHHEIVHCSSFREQISLVKGLLALEKILNSIDQNNFNISVKKHFSDVFEIRITTNKNYEQELKNLLQKVQR